MEVSTHDLDGAQLHLTTPTAESGYDKATITVFVSSSGGGGGQPPNMGSMVYALPAKRTVSTRLFQIEDSIDSAERLAKSLAAKINRPVICSVSGMLDLTVVHEVVSIVCDKMSI